MTFSRFLHAVVYAIVIAASIGLWRKYIFSFSERTLNDVVPFVRKVSLDDLQNLLHPEVEQHIQTTLPAEKFRNLQWKRIQLTLRYVEDIADNAKILQAWGKYERYLSRKFPDLARRTASLALIASCMQSRLWAFRIRLTLKCWLIRMAFLPFLAPPSFARLKENGSFDVFALYDEMRRTASDLCRPYGDHFYQTLREIL